MEISVTCLTKGATHTDTWLTMLSVELVILCWLVRSVAIITPDKNCFRKLATLFFQNKKHWEDDDSFYQANGRRNHRAPARPQRVEALRGGRLN